MPSSNFFKHLKFALEDYCNANLHVDYYIITFYYTPRNEVRGGVYWNHPVRPSVRL